MKPKDPEGEREGAPRLSGALRGAAERGLSIGRKVVADAREATTDGARAVDLAARKGARSAAERAQQATAIASDRARRASAAASETTQRAANLVGAGAQRTTAFLGESSGAIASFLALPELLRWTESVTKSAATIYDKALDAKFLRTHIGGGNHRMFDGGHGLRGAWVQVRDVAPDDSLGEAVLAYAEALWKDGTTVKGLPFATWDKADYDRFAEHLCSVPGVNRAWVYDLLSYDVFEVFSAGLGTVGVLFALRRDDLEKLSELLGSLGITSILSANPIMGLMVIMTTGYAYSRKRRDNADGTRLSVTRAASGATLAGFSAALFAILGLPVLVELGVVLVASHLAKKHVLENTVLRAILSSRIQESKEGATRTTERLLLLIRAEESTGEAF